MKKQKKIKKEPKILDRIAHKLAVIAAILLTMVLFVFLALNFGKGLI